MYNFSVKSADAQEKVQQCFNLALDLARLDYTLEDGVTVKDLETDLRQKIKDDILGGRTFYQAIRANEILIYEITEQIVNVAISENVFDSPFCDAFVDVKYRNLGDESAWYAEGGLLSTAKFSGNYWDTDRESLDIGEEIKLPKEWIKIHVYEEIERFYTGVAHLDKVMDKIYKSVNKALQDRIYAQFNNVTNAVPSDFTATCNDSDGVLAMADKVMAAGGYSNLIIAGTRIALNKLAGKIPTHMFANSQKEAKAMTGSVGNWEGFDLMLIPQTLQSGTFTPALDNTKIFILGGDTKPIKVDFYGDTRSKIKDEFENNDQTVDIQLQTLFGMGLVLPAYFAVITLQ